MQPRSPLLADQRPSDTTAAEPLGIAHVRSPDVLGAALGEGIPSQSAFSASVAFPRYRRYRAERFFQRTRGMNGDVGFGRRPSNVANDPKRTPHWPAFHLIAARCGTPSQSISPRPSSTICAQRAADVARFCMLAPSVGVAPPHTTITQRKARDGDRSRRLLGHRCRCRRPRGGARARGRGS